MEQGTGEDRCRKHTVALFWGVFFIICRSLNLAPQLLLGTVLSPDAVSRSFPAEPTAVQGRKTCYDSCVLSDILSAVLTPFATRRHSLSLDELNVVVLCATARPFVSAAAPVLRSLLENASEEAQVLLLDHLWRCSYPWSTWTPGTLQALTPKGRLAAVRRLLPQVGDRMQVSRALAEYVDRLVEESEAEPQ